MKFWAKVTFRGERNAEHLIRAFFKEFNPESSIVIRGRGANVEIFFEKKPPLEIVEAISYCDIIEFNFGKNVEEYSEQEKNEESFKEAEVEENVDSFDPFEKPLEEIPEMTSEVRSEDSQVEENQPVENKLEKTEETKEIAGGNESNAEEPKKKRAKATSDKKDETKKDKDVKIPKLDEFAQKVTTFEAFVNAVATWLEMDKRHDFFVNLAIMASEVEKITWKSLVEGLEKKGIPCSQWDKIWTTRQVSEKLKNENVTILALLKAMTKYNPFYLTSKYLNKECVKQETAVEEKNSNKETKMESDSEISALQNIFNSVDKTQTVEERVSYVLNEMGLEMKSESERLQIFELVNTAVKVERMNFDIIFLKANIPMEESMNARMNLSTFVNDFVKKYDSSKKVKVLDFLKQLQENIMYSDEIERFDDFSE